MCMIAMFVGGVIIIVNGPVSRTVMIFPTRYILFHYLKQLSLAKR